MAPAGPRASFRRPSVLLLAGVCVALALPTPALAAPRGGPTGTSSAPPSAARPSPARPAAAPTPVAVGPTPTPTRTPSATPRPPAASARPDPSPSPDASTAPTPAPTPQPTSTPTGDGPTALVSPDAAAAAAAPVLGVTVAVGPTVTAAGQQVSVTVTVRNTGAQPAADLAVSAVAANLHAPTCTPTAQGGTLAVGATTTCTSTRTSTQEDLRTHGGTVSATAAGFAPDGTAVTGTGTARLVVTTAAPRATDDVVATTSGRSVVVPASTNDGPAVPGGPAIDPTRTVFEQLDHPEGNPNTKNAQTTHGFWYVRADGSVLFVPFDGDRTGGTDTVPYLVFDSAGHSAAANLTVTMRPGAQGVPDQVSTKQGLEVVAHPLANDKAGQQADGTPARLLPESLRFDDTQPVGDADVSADGSTLDIPFTGHFQHYLGEIDFQPLDSFTGTVSVGYAVTDSVGNVATSTVTFTVTPQVPTARNLSATTGVDGEPDVAGFGWSQLDTAPATGIPVQFGGFTGRDGTPLGTTVQTPQGEWFFRLSQEDGIEGSVGFQANPAFSGTTSIGYAMVDFNETRATGRLTVTVRPWALTRPDLLLSVRGADAVVDPGANDTPAPLPDGKPGSFDPRYATFPEEGQPTGSVVSDHGKTLTVPGRGRLWFSNGRVTFRPQPGFTGDGGTVAYALEERGASVFVRGRVDVGSLHLAVTGDRPVAVDDTAVTPYGCVVTLPGATDDDAGSAPGPLTATFPTLGQPDGSGVSADGRTLGVPDEGSWRITSAGTVTFVPATGFTGATSTVLYRITRADRASATGTLQVTVAQGIVAAPSSASYAQGRDLVVDPLAHVSPGYDADGTLGTLDATSVRFTATGQAQGAVVSDDGRSLSYARGSADDGFAFRVDPATGLVDATVPSGFRGTTPRARFSVQGTVKDSTGAGFLLQAGSTVSVTVTGRDPVAVDDHVTVDGDVFAVLPAALNDIPASSSLPLDVYDTSLPYDQLGDLPKGSQIEYVETYIISYWVALVPGEGYWEIDPYSGRATFDPSAGFTGTTTPLRYRVHDSAGNSADGLLTVTVRKNADLAHHADTVATPQGVPVTVDVAANATSGQGGGSSPVPDPAGAYFDASQTSGATEPPGSNQRTLVVAREGTYTVGYGSTRVTFRPVPGFRGTTSRIAVRTSTDASTLQIRVTGVDPAAADDAVSTPRGTPVRIRLLDNDAAGSPTRVLVTSTVRLEPTGLPAGAVLSADRQVLALPGRGTFAVAGDGTLTFYPRSGFSGTVPAVGYQVADLNGTRAHAAVAVRVT